jgi:hypothetical protein
VPDGVEVEFADAMQALRRAGRGSAVEWWERHFSERLAPPPLLFRTNEGRLMPASYADRLFHLDDFDSEQRDD